MPEYIFNTTALSNFAAADRLDLLAERYGDRAFTTVVPALPFFPLWHPLSSAFVTRRAWADWAVERACHPLPSAGQEPMSVQHQPATFPRAAGRPGWRSRRQRCKSLKV